MFVNIMMIVPRMLCGDCETDTSNVEGAVARLIEAAGFGTDITAVWEPHSLGISSQAEPLMLYRYLAQLFTKVLLSEAAPQHDRRSSPGSAQASLLSATGAGRELLPKVLLPAAATGAAPPRLRGCAERELGHKL